MLISPAQGSYPGQPASRAYQVNLTAISMPRRVAVNGHPLPMVRASSSAVGWHYDAATATLVIRTPRLPTSQPATITQAGGRPVRFR